jgi:hypothetical protein
LLTISAEIVDIAQLVIDLNMHEIVDAALLSNNNGNTFDQ